MARHPWLDPSPFVDHRGPTAVLLIHGFTGAPTEMRPFGEFLAEQGYTVSGPLLPGHGTEPADLNRVRWQDWTAAVTSAHAALAAHADRIFVAGFSLGGLLALQLAAAEPAISGLLLFAPGLLVRDWRLPLSALARHVLPFVRQDDPADFDFADPQGFYRTWCYEVVPIGGASQVWRLQRAVRRALPAVSQPLLLFQGKLDRAVRRESPQAILDRVSSTDTQLAWLENSGHSLLLDGERHAVFERCLQWIRAHEGDGGAP